MRAAFSGRALALPKCASGNVVILGAAGEPVEIADGELSRRTRALRSETGLNLLRPVTGLKAALPGDGTLRL